MNLHENHYNDADGLSQRATNKVLETLKVYFSQEQVTHLSESMLDMQIDSELSPEGRAYINKNLPILVEAMCDKKNGIREMDASEVEDFIRTLSQIIISREKLDCIEIAVGIGGSVSAPSIRCPAYILPAIKILRGIKEFSHELDNEGLPSVRVFKANHIASFVNGYDIGQLKDVSSVTIAFYREFIEKFYSNFYKNFSFQEDQDCYTPLSDARGAVEGLVDELMAGKVFEEESMQPLLKMAEKYSEKGVTRDELNRKATLYAVMHPFYFGSISHKAILPFNTDSEKKLIITQGGQPEKTFNAVCRELQKRFADQYDTVPTLRQILGVGKRPVYYSARDGDFLLSQITKGEQPKLASLKEFDRQTHIDVKAILKETDPSDYLDFLNDFSSRYKEVLSKIG